MRLLVTGASGFLGQYVVANALQRGYFVRAVVRPGRTIGSLPWSSHPALEVFEADLAKPDSLATMLLGIDCVIHLAASKSGNFDDAYQGTVVTTNHLLSAMEQARVWRLVCVSSFSVYDYSHLDNHSVLDETCPLETRPEQRDAYAQTKLLQEEAVRQFSALPEAAITILRPGMIYGQEALWNACQGAGVGPLWLLIGPNGHMPLTYVENCADAILQSVETNEAIDTILNIVDDPLPNRRQYTQALIKHGHDTPTIVPITWSFCRGIAQMASLMNLWLFLGRVKLPGLLNPVRLDARFKPFTYSNSQAKKTLDWQPAYTWQDAIARCLSEERNQAKVC
ncbi:MAG: NAD(P)-dependent oxidoreductase [Leptolyngbyaceae cyanobacterium SM2_5_2]|nr:NAD(P)-dependent oxidoreductase [Leptolyngbyaceae cyanobacterium SM2_5_2]